MTRITCAAVLGLTLLFAACSDDPVATQEPKQERLFNAAEGDDVTPLARYRVLPSFSGLTSKLIGPAGGSISVGGFEIEIPQGALEKPTIITINIPSESIQTGRVWAEFGPHGQKFSTPVKLKLPYAGTTSDGDSVVHVLWYDGISWVRLPSSLTRDGRIQTQTSHFSEYGTEEGENGKGITLGN